MNRRSGREPESIKYFAAEEFAFFNGGQDTTRLGVYRFVADHHRDGTGSEFGRTRENTYFSLNHRPGDQAGNEICVANKIGHKSCAGRIVYVLGSSDLLELTAPDDRDLICHPECFLLVVC